MMLRSHDLARCLADRAETVCCIYLSNGRRQGNYWLVGDVRNTLGRSMFVRLKDTAKGAAGKWTDAATGEHGDLLDVIRESCGLVDFADVVEEARTFLSLTHLAPDRPKHEYAVASVSSGSSDAARRLFAMSQPIAGTLAETYLRGRGITIGHGAGCLRFHRRCYYRPSALDRTQTWPAMVAAVTDLGGKITGVHRTYLAPSLFNPDDFDPIQLGKAPIDTPRRAMGDLLGHAVRFGIAEDVIAAGEGIETVLSLQQILPNMPMLAALSAAHLAAILFPPSLRRLYIARDNDPAGNSVSDSLIERADAAGIDAIVLSPTLGDFNEDLRILGIDAFRANIRVQLVPHDVARFLEPSA